MSHMTEQIGRVLGGRYRLLSPLGSGASADVYAADDVRLHRKVAVKVLHPALADDQEFLRRFRAEVRTVAALDHPNVLAIYDWNGEREPYLVTEHLDGGSLRSMLDAGHRLSPSQALVVGLQAAQGLDVAHRQGFVHRNIKPANLLFGGDGRLRVADLGLARAVAEAALTEPAGAITGAARYASPEQARGEPLTGHSDIYSLALVLVEAVTGQVPFAADTTFATLTARLDQPVEIPEGLGPLGSVLSRAGAPIASERPDAAELASELKAIASELPRPAELPLVAPIDLREGAPRQHADATEVVPLPGSLPHSPSSAAGYASAPAVPAWQTGLNGPAMSPTAPQPSFDPAYGAPMPASAIDDEVDQPLAAQPYGVQPPPRHSRPRSELPAWAIPTVVVLFALLVGAGGMWLLREASVPTHEVPQALIGSHIGEINNHVGSYGWRIVQVEDRADGTEPGEILQTRPEPGSQLKEGEKLEVVVSLGGTLVDLPVNLEGLKLEEADQRLTTAGFQMEVERQPHDTVEVDHVIGVAEGTGEQAPKGSTVTLVVSSGSPSPTIPDVTGWEWEDARDTLEDLGLKPNRQRTLDAGFGRGQVVATDPPAQTQVEPGTEVTVYVSRNPFAGGGGDGDDGLVQVPWLFGKTMEEAIKEIENNDLEVGTANGSSDDVVLTQSPMGGTMVEPGTEVDLSSWQ